MLAIVEYRRGRKACACMMTDTVLPTWHAIGVGLFGGFVVF
jgi:hypothetical protein